MMPGTWKDKHVVITGGSQGLGLAMATKLAKSGARVTIISRSESKLAKAKQSILQVAPSSSIITISIDLSVATSNELAAALDTACVSHGRIDVAIANAGTGHARLMIDGRCAHDSPITSPRSQFDSYLNGLLSLNGRGTINLLTEAANRMSADAKGGRLCLVSSAAGLISLPGYAFYSATKFGHRGVVAGATHELLRHQIFLSVFYPGSILTPGYQSELEDRPKLTDRIESSCSATSSAESVANAALIGIQTGDKEFSNELLPQLTLDAPTGFIHLDLLIVLIVALIKIIWDLYLDIMTSLYLADSYQFSVPRQPADTLSSSTLYSSTGTSAPEKKMSY
eukprot:CAMPEP_0197329868 /NCGR_PEP_ID=MMETSP0892-20130614/6261_1 /TAXON_ID=44058 ORGANISM="Aureoumbra lagunensis, Strain CCMP1510" /NCGR_SAMPLE_ID=MMETSP0892 /ASSEMBLY_ACC=CAM_ASM_000538 /LENGTH=338 /DNA_ID=CAMNT_0042826741 /DNA_START=196 /DNA_END=1210 /DNA_ORIENTATION=+